MNVWILVCDSAKSRLFESWNGSLPWTLAEELVHGESRSRASALVTDRSGTRSPEGGSTTHNALAPASEPKENEKEHFARTLAKVLDQGLRSGRFRKWVLVAAPRFAGMLKKELTPELGKHLLSTVDKDFTAVEARDLPERLKDAVSIPLDELEVIHETHKRPH